MSGEIKKIDSIKNRAVFRTSDGRHLSRMTTTTSLSLNRFSLRQI
jgi:hypothetical protein